MHETMIDQAFEGMFRSVAGRTSRRSVLGRLSHLLMAAVGIELIPLLPIDRRVMAQQPPCQPVNCSNWKWCGMTGKSCTSCYYLYDVPPFVEEIPPAYCPYGMSCCGAWAQTCADSNGNTELVLYTDCCYNPSAMPPEYLPECANTWCCNQNQPTGPNGEICDVRAPNAGLAYCDLPSCVNSNSTRYFCTAVSHKGDNCNQWP